jgi:hypothetical protein
MGRDNTGQYAEKGTGITPPAIEVSTSKRPFSAPLSDNNLTSDILSELARQQRLVNLCHYCT